MKSRAADRSCTGEEGMYTQNALAPSAERLHSDRALTGRLGGRLHACAAWLLLAVVGSPVPMAAHATNIAPLLNAGTSGGSDVPLYAEYDKKIRASEQVGALTSDLFGDVVSPYAGQTEFGVVDIDVPGNNALPVQLRRRFVVSAVMNDQLSDNAGGRGNPYGGLANWDIEVPHIYGVFDLQIGWDTRSSTGGPAGTPRCTNYFQPGTQTNFDGYVWSGNKVHIPGKGEREMLLQDAGYPPIHIRSSKEAGAPWTTKELDSFACTSITNGSFGQGFVMTTTEGISYSFDIYMERAYPAVSMGALRNPRKMIFLLASKVTDRYGNWVAYSYDGYGHPTSITSNDGRSISFVYNSTNQTVLSTATVTSTAPTQSRVWRYGYTSARDGLRLTTVTLPDNLSQWIYDYASLNPNDEYLYVSYTPPDPSGRECLPSTFSGGHFNFKITHPSGSEGTFRFQMKRLSRYLPPNIDNFNCVDGPGGARVFLVPAYVDSFALTEKTITDTAASSSQWQYQYRLNTGCRVGSCDTAKNRVIQPDGSAIDSTYSIYYGATIPVMPGATPPSAAVEGSLLKAEYANGPGGTVLRSEDYAYVTGPDVAGQAFPGQSFSSRYGSGGAADDSSSGSIRPLKSVTTTQQGATFTRSNQSFDAYARPLSVQMSSSLGYSRTENTTYLDNDVLWVLGLVDTRKDSSIGTPIVDNDYDSKLNLTDVREFGVLKRSMTYRSDGTLSTVYDGAHTTTLGTFKRGIPQSVNFADGNLQRASVSDFGDILSVTDEDSYTTNYGYDLLGRLTSIAYPSGDSVTWNGVAIQYDRVAASEMGISGMHWRQTRTRGNGKNVTYYDQRLRPVVTQEYDAANQGGTQRYVLRRYDYANRETFVSYPSSTFAPTTGTTTQYDAIGRVFKVMQDSEQGTLTTQTDYLSSFKKQVTDPRGQVTTTTFKAFESPSEDAPATIAAPEGVTIQIGRDILNKPTYVTRSGAYGGSSVSQTRRYVYDVGQRLCKTIEPESGATIQDYDAAGNVSWSTKGSTLTTLTCDRDSVPTADRTNYDYDARNRLKETNAPGGISINQAYWPNGKLKTTSSDGAVWTYSYNRRQLLESESLEYDGQNFLIDWSYDANGSLSQVMYPDESLVSFAPNALGQPTRAGSYATNVSYFANGAIKNFTYGNNVVHSMTQNVRQLPARSQDGTVTDLSYAYDASANVASITDNAQSGTESRTLGYDGLNRLTSASAPGLWGNASFTYDPLDNLRTSAVGIRSCTHAYSTVNRLSGISGTNCPAMNYVYDARGNTISRGSQGLVFDRLDRLTAATGKESYAYDGLGRRVSATPTNGGGKRYQVYSKDGQLLFGWDEAANKSTSYVYLNGSLVARNEVNPQAPGLPPPAAPSVSPNPSSNGNYTVSWLAVTGASSYALTEVANGGAETPVYTGALLSWSPPSPKPNGSYVYRVRACATACSDYSGTTTATVQIAPGVLTLDPNPSATGTYTVSWAAVAGATGYALTESVNGASPTTVYSGTALSWTPPAAKPDGSYTYRLQTCSGACGPPSAPATETVATGIPAALDGSPNPNTSGNYTVSWNPVTSAVAYRLEERVNPSGNWAEVQNSSSRTRAFSSRPVGSYQYRVRACRIATDVSYCGAFQDPAGYLTVQVFQQPPTIPVAPGGIGGLPNPSLDGNYTVTWSESTGATRYELQEKYCYGDPQETCEPNWRALVTTSGRSWSPPTPKTGYGKYTYQVRACNTAGCSDYRQSGPVKVQLPNVLPDRPVMAVYASPNPSTNGIYTISWNAMARAARYELQESATGATGTWADISTVLTGTNWTTPTARPNGYFFYRARACNVYGCSSYSANQSQAIVQIPAPVTMPTNFRVMGAGAVNQSYKFYWDPVTGASEYQLREKVFSCSQIPDATTPIGANEPQPYKIIGRLEVCNGQEQDPTTYVYDLRACNGAACSEWTPTVRMSVSGRPVRRPEGATTMTTYVHTDGLRSPVAETNASGTVTSRLRYEPYGAPTTGVYEQGLGYAGHVTDAATGLSYMQQRYYDPLAGRFLSTDPVPASPGSFNRYAYANNNPYKYIDLDGRCPKNVGSHLCIESATFDSSRSSGKNVVGTPAMDKAVSDQKRIVQTKPGSRKEPLASLNEQKDGSLKVQSVDRVTRESGDDADKASGKPPGNSKAIVHGHTSRTVSDDQYSIGDADSLKSVSRPNYAVSQDGRVMIQELENGRYQVRMVVGEMTDAEVKYYTETTTKRQDIFYDR